MIWFVNYKSDTSLTVTDRGLAYGDGVFETISATSKSLLHIDDHLSRLYRGLTKLGMPFSEDQKQNLCTFLYSSILPLIESDSVVKIMVTRGEGGRGYLPPENCLHTVIIGILPAPDYETQRQKGVSLSVSPVPASENRFLAGTKHLNRLENVMAKQFLMKSDFEAIMLNNNDEVVECIQSNVFWLSQGALYTPSLATSGVQGTFRKYLIENQEQYLIQIGQFPLSDLLNADEVFITNSLMGIVPVTHIAGKSFPIGMDTRKLQTLM
ncbi:MAG: aminodeoxychorismate lyase [Marinomonas sp.]